MDLPQLDQLVLNGAMGRLAEVCGVSKSSVTFQTSTNRMQLIERLQKANKGPAAQIKWPQMAVRLSSLQTGVQGEDTAYTPKNMLRRGVYVQVADSNNVLYNVKVMPTSFIMEVTLLTDDFFQAFDFATKWVRAAVLNAFNFTINYGSASFDIRVKADDNVTTPDRDEAVSHPNLYEYVTNMTVWGYSADPKARNIPVLNQAQVSVVPAMPNAAQLLPPRTFSSTE